VRARLPPALAKPAQEWQRQARTSRRVGRFVEGRAGGHVGRLAPTGREAKRKEQKEIGQHAVASVKRKRVLDADASQRPDLVRIAERHRDKPVYRLTAIRTDGRAIERNDFETIRAEQGLKVGARMRVAARGAQGIVVGTVMRL